MKYLLNRWSWTLSAPMWHREGCGHLPATEDLSPTQWLIDIPEWLFVAYLLADNEALATLANGYRPQCCADCLPNPLAVLRPAPELAHAG
jgi:hypothetical protein